jgi:hypothetical protein
MIVCCGEFSVLRIKQDQGVKNRKKNRGMYVSVRLSSEAVGHACFYTRYLGIRRTSLSLKKAISAYSIQHEQILVL